jgi:predicted kinase
MPRPLLVLVSGHPGAGKTTLGRVLGDAMQLPHLNRDRLRDGMEPLDQPRTWTVFLDTIRLWLDNDISVVADQTLYTGMVDDLRALTAHGCVVNVHCRCPNAYARWVDKVRAHEGWEAVADRVRRERPQTIDPLPLGVPIIEVETSDGYDPTLDELVRAIADSRW